MLKSLLLLLFLLFPLYSFTQKYIPHTTTFTEEHGFSDMSWNTIFQDSKNLIWTGTNYGLNCYDGCNVYAYTSINHDLQKNIISNLAEDYEGNIWIAYPKLYSLSNGGTQGVDVLDPITKELMPIEEKIKDIPFSIQDITIIKTSAFTKKTIWIGTKNGQIFFYGKDGFILKYKHYKEAPILHLFESSPNIIWTKIGRERNDYSIYALSKEGKVLDRLESKKGQESLFIFGIQDSSKLLLTNDKKSNLYLKEIGEPLNKITLPLSNHEILSVLPHYQQFWTWNQEKLNRYIHLYDYHWNLIDSIKAPSFLYEDALIPVESSLHVSDREGGIWFSSSKHKQGFALYLKYTPFQRKYCSEDLFQSTGVLARGITRLSNDSLVLCGTFSSAEQYNNIFPGLKIFETSKGDIWHIHEGAIKQIRNQKEIVISNRQGILNTGCIIEDKSGIIWIGHNKGISLFNREGKLLDFLTKNEHLSPIQEVAVNHFHENEMGMWLVTQNGLYLINFKKNTVQHFYKGAKDSNAYIPFNTLLHLHEDQQGFFWIASEGGGLIKWHPKTKAIKQFTSENGLSHNIIYSVYEDTHNELWLSSAKGLMNFKKEDESTTVFLQKDGISHNEFNKVSHFQDKDGITYFGGRDGITIVNSSKIKAIFSKNKKHKLQIGRVFKNEKKEDLTQAVLDNNSITLNASDKSLLIKLAYPFFYTSKAKKYAYRIKEIDKQWKYTTTPNIFLTDLPYGKITLLVKIKNDSTSLLEIPINVQEPFYLSTKNIVLSCILLFLAISLLVYYIVVIRKRELERKITIRTNKINEDKKNIEEQAAKLRKIHTERSNFFTDISHELRTPLTLILGPLQQITATNDLTKEDLNNKIQNIQQNGENILELIDEILELSKIDQDILELKKEYIHLYTFFEKIFKSFEEQANTLQIVTSFEYTISKQAYAYLDKKKVRKILNNLLFNALKFTPAKHEVKLQIYLEKNNLSIKVIDNGIGIDAEDLPYIFNRYYKAKQKPLRDYNSNGIGLSLSKSLTELMGGDLSVNSELHKGTTFFLSILVESISDKIIEPGLEEKKDIVIANYSKVFSALIVDDNEQLHAFIKNALSKLNCNFYSVFNGQEALDFLTTSSNKIDLIISDLKMPLMDGISFFKKLKEVDYLSIIPIIAITGHAAPRQKLDVLTIGIDSYLTKPFLAEELLVHVLNILYNYNERILWHTKNSKESNENHLSITLSIEDQKWIKSVEKYTKDNISNSFLNAAHVAINFNMTEQTFRRRLKRITGMLPVKYIRELKLQTARELLEKRQYNTIQQVCAHVGFKTPHYFSKQFKQRFGRSPNEMLK